MALYLIGIGLYDEKDITLRGLEAVKAADVVYVEHYTSILNCSQEDLEAFYGREVHMASRNLVEQEADEKLIATAKDKDVALLIVGDVFGATTHTDLVLRAKKAGVQTKVIYNASVMSAIGATGLELYKFSKTTSIVFPDNNWLPDTPYNVIFQNQEQGLHTLCLLDIKVAEASAQEIRESAISGRQAKTSPPRYMTIAQALDVLLRLEEKHQKGLITKDTLAVGVARLGHPDELIVAGTIAQLQETDFGGPLHSLIIPGKLHVVEQEALDMFKN
ncbi:MAG: diphthine synthase [Candidatus Nanoarchaeia archaeon]